VIEDGRRVEHRVPPPLFWTQIPSFHEVAYRLLLQNLQNKGVICKIFQDKELRHIGRTTGEKEPESYCATKGQNYLQTVVPLARLDPQVLEWLRSNGIKIYGTAAHGSSYCKSYHYMNFYF